MASRALVRTPLRVFQTRGLAHATEKRFSIPNVFHTTALARRRPVLLNPESEEREESEGKSTRVIGDKTRNKDGAWAGNVWLPRPNGAHYGLLFEPAFLEPLGKTTITSFWHLRGAPLDAQQHLYGGLQAIPFQVNRLAIHVKTKAPYAAWRAEKGGIAITSILIGSQEQLRGPVAIASIDHETRVNFDAIQVGQQVQISLKNWIAEEATVQAMFVGRFYFTMPR
jgi:hypothetical protein